MTNQELSLLTMIAPLEGSTDPEVGDPVDLGPYIETGRRGITAILSARPAGGDTDETLSVKFQDSASTVDSDFSDISGAAFTTVIQEASPAFEKLVFIPGERYIRAYATLAGTTPVFEFAVSAIAKPRFV